MAYDKEQAFKELRICNFCKHASIHGLPEGIVCDEEHHQEGKDRWQHYHHSCEYFEKSKKDIYDIKQFYRRKSLFSKEYEYKSSHKEHSKWTIERSTKRLLLFNISSQVIIFSGFIVFNLMMNNYLGMWIMVGLASIALIALIIISCIKTRL